MSAAHTYVSLMAFVLAVLIIEHWYTKNKDDDDHML